MRITVHLYASPTRPFGPFDFLGKLGEPVRFTVAGEEREAVMVDYEPRMGGITADVTYQLPDDLGTLTHDQVRSALEQITG